jgi:short-subunit dehydrogenase
MNILVLGASSLIGAALAREFSPGNGLFLGGRSKQKLSTIKSDCEDAGANQVSTIEFDLSDNIEPLFRFLQNVRLDLIIDAASASSEKRDSDIWSENMEKLCWADLMSRFKLFDRIKSENDYLPEVIFISTILTKVKSPGRVVYTSLKGLYEMYLKSLRIRQPEFRLMIVYLGTVVDPKSSSDKPKRIATSISAAFKRGNHTFTYGLIGRLYVLLFSINPLVFHAVTLLQRRIRIALMRRVQR